MNGMKTLAYSLTTIKLLLSLPLLLCSLLMLYDILFIVLYGIHGVRVGLPSLLMTLAAIGLGYPFSWIGTNGFVASIIIALSATPLCVAISNPAFRWLTPIAILWMILALVDLVLSKRLPPTGWQRPGEPKQGRS